MTGQHLSMEAVGDESGLEFEKVWISSGDPRTRDTHDAADGESVGMQERFSVGRASLRYPGDPQGPPEEIINCRCAVAYEPI